MNKVLKNIYESGMKIIFVLCIIFTVQSCKDCRFTQHELDAFLTANQNQFLELSKQIIGENPPSLPHYYIIGTIYHMPISDGSRMFFEIDIFNQDSKYYEVEDQKYGQLFFNLISDNKVRSNVLGRTSEFNLLSVSNSEIRFSNENVNYSFKKVTDSFIIKSLENSPKVDTNYLQTEYNGIYLP